MHIKMDFSTNVRFLYKK